MEQDILVSEFSKDVIEGLSSNPKVLSSKYFYDDEGSRIFQDIMRMPEYYLTNCEFEIFKNQKQDIYIELLADQEAFELIELGAGDGLKTKVLLEHFLDQEADFEYMPIDISKEAVLNLVHDVKEKFPKLKTNGKVGDYFQLINEINQNYKIKKVLLFLGSNIGNFSEKKSIEFLKHLRSVMQKGDMLFIGFDLKKEKDIILKAYNDPYGHTAAFNINLLHRINNELDANFSLSDFHHIETYDPKTGTAKSYLVSLQKQNVYIRSLGKEIVFDKGETIYMEMSQKYDEKMIENLAEKSGFEIVRNFTDSRQYYTNSLWISK